MAGSVRPQKKKKGWLIALVIVLVIIAAAVVFIVVRAAQARQAMADLGDLDSVAYQKGSLTASISGTGTVRANQTAMLSWSTSGNVGKVNIALGDTVAADCPALIPGRNIHPGGYFASADRSDQCAAAAGCAL